jgi:prephenate dehydratase
MSNLPNRTLIPKPLKISDKRNRIVIQGVSGAFHEIAARKFYGENIDIVPALSFVELFEKNALPKVAEAAILAIENSIAGSILGNYNLLQKSDFTIIGEVTIPIQQDLMVLPGVPMSEIREIHSHPMALAQCSQFLKKYPNIRPVESEDTAESASRIARRHLKHTAAIGSSLAAKMYNLEIIAPAIEDNKENFTRFLAVQRKKDATRIQFANKASVSFSTPHKPGSLSIILKMLADKNANLTKIQSVPLIGKPFEYLFFLDFTVQNTEILPEILKELNTITNELKILGTYASH